VTPSEADEQAAREPALAWRTRSAWRREQQARSGHDGTHEQVRDDLAAADPSLRAGALRTLQRGGTLAVEDLVAALRDPEPEVRRTAAELAATHGVVDLRDALGDADPSVVETACWAVGEQATAPAGADSDGATDRAGVVELLAGIAGGHPDALCREAAVAALGAIGDDAGLPAVLAACHDRPAVRRRAVLALAPFEGPEVEAALRAALDDRDWQVRQAAEDLTS
jgi:HEAT repeat protein